MNLKITNNFEYLKFYLILILFTLCLSTSFYTQDAIFTKSGQKYDCKIIDINNVQVNFSTYLLKSTRKTFINLENVDTTIYHYDKNILSNASIFCKDGRTIQCRIESLDDNNYYYHEMDNGSQPWAYISISSVDTVLYSQSSSYLNQRNNDGFLSFGAGLDHGGLGIQGAANLTESISLFAGVGYNIIGLGYNIGTKLYLKSDDVHRKTIPFFEAMYGYNTVIVFNDRKEDNKTFYGPSFGLGLDFYTGSTGNFLSFGILLPVRGKAVDEYIQKINRINSVIFHNNLTLIGLTLGFGIPIN